MKKIFIASLCSLFYLLSTAQVAINNSNATPDASAMLDISSTLKGLLIPRMSTAERTAISSPVKGLLVFANDDNSFWYYTGTQWIDLVSTSSSIWKRNGNHAFASNTGNVVVGTATPHPDARFHVFMGNAFTQGFLVTGNSDVLSSSVPDIGEGARLMFYPGKGSFRAGGVNGAHWDNFNTGEYSSALGFNTTATGGYSTALGAETFAAGVSSTAMGYQTMANDNYSTAMGYVTTAGGISSTAMGYNTKAFTLGSTSMGFYSVARGFASTVTGMYNDSIFTTSQASVSAGSPLFLVGNGDAVSNRSNALVVTKDGRIWIDPNNKNSGSSSDNAIMFGNYFSSGSSIASKRTSGGNQNGLDFYTSSSNRMSITSAGNVGIGIDVPTEKLHVIGNICATGTIASCSDIRYKTNLIPVSNVLSSVLSLHPIYYNWRKEFKEKGFTNDRQIGFSAQEIEKFFPEMVQTNADGYKAVDYSRMAPVLVEAIKEQQKEMNELKKEAKDQRQEIELLKQQVKWLLKNEKN